MITTPRSAAKADDDFPALIVTNVQFKSASETDQETGLLAYLTVEINDGMELDGLTLRRNIEGDLYLSFPCRDDRYGRRHFYSRPLNGEIRADLEDQVLRKLGFEILDEAEEES